MQIRAGQTTEASGEPWTAARRGRWAVSLVFASHGVVLASWAPHVPYVRDRHHLDDGQLGLVLLAVAVGAVLAMTVAGRLLSRVSPRKATRVAAVAHVFTLPLLVLAPNVALLVAALALYGAVLGSMDVVMNAVALKVEAGYGRPILSSVHGMYSIGSLVGAVAAAGLLRAGLTPLTHTGLISVVVLALLVPILRALPADDLPLADDLAPTAPQAEPGGRHGGGHRSGAVWVIGMMTLAVLVGEGSVVDWSANLLHGDLGASRAFAALGLASFSVAMAIGRLSGDRIRHRFGDVRLVRGGASLAAVGLAGGLLIGRPWAALIGFALLGLGYANIVPLLFSAGGRAADPPALGISTVASVGYLGFLVGPPTIGFLAQAFSLDRALLVVAALAAFVALAAPRVAPDFRRETGGPEGETGLNLASAPGGEG